MAAILEGSTPDRATGYKGLTKLDPVLFLETVVDDYMVTGMAEWLDQSTHVQTVMGSSTPRELQHSVYERLPALCKSWWKCKWNQQVVSHLEEGKKLQCFD